jgi:tRNA1(Val) A37 N6-methylase TrmN6
VLLRAIKGSRSPSRLLPPLVLHGETGNAFLPPVERILRQGAGIADVHPSWGA